MKEFTSQETRFNMLGKTNPQHAQELEELAQKDVNERWSLYEEFARVLGGSKDGED